MSSNSILVIENEATTVTMVERSLQNEGYTIHAASDADSGLQRARELVPSLILLNLAVQGANGLEVCKTIHTDETLKDVPLILLTLREGKFDPIYTKLYGIVNFLKKPFTPDQLIENVREFAPFDAAAGAPAAEATGMAESEEEFTFEEPAGAIGGLDESIEPEPSYGGLDEPVEPEPSYGGIDEPLESVSEIDVDTSDDAFNLDEDVSLEEIQDSFLSDQPGGAFAGTAEDEDIGQEPEMPSFDETEAADETTFSGLGEELPSFDEGSAEQEEDAFSMPAEEEAPSPLQESSTESFEPDMSFDDIGFDQPEEAPVAASSLDTMDFDLPGDTSTFAEPSGPVAVMEEKSKRKKKKKEKKRKTVSRGNQPRSKRVLVLVAIIVPLLVLAGASVYFFLLREPSLPQVAQAPVKKAVSQKPAPPPQAPAQAAPPAAGDQGVIPPPPGTQPPSAITEPPKAPVPAPEQTATPKTPVHTPRKIPPKKPAPVQADVAQGARFTVQFGVFGNEKNAQSLVGKLQKSGVDAYVKKKSLSSGKSVNYVLLKGGYKTKDSAIKKAKDIQRAKGFDTTVHTL